MLDGFGGGLFEFEFEPDGDDEHDAGAEEENSEAVPVEAVEGTIEIGEAVDEDAPEDGRKAEAEVGDDGIESEEMVPAHFGGHNHGEADVGHIEDGSAKAHTELEGKNEAWGGSKVLSGQQEPDRDDAEPEQRGKNHHRFAAKRVEPPAEPKAQHRAQEEDGTDHEDGGFGHRGLRFEEGDREGAHAAIGGGPTEIHDQEFLKRGMLEHRQPWDRLPGSADIFGDGDIRDALEEIKADDAVDAAEEKDGNEMERAGVLAEDQGRDQEGGATGHADERLVAGEILAAEGSGNERGNPREPGAARDAAEQIENEKEKEDERELSFVFEKGHPWNRRNEEDENDTASPARVDKFFVADATDVVGGGDLEDNEDGQHASDDPENGGGSAEALGVKNHRAAKDDLEGKGIERREHESVVQARRKLLGGAIQGAVFLALAMRGGNAGKALGITRHVWR